MILSMQAVDSFFDEVGKIAGVGWDLHGYKENPDVLQKKLEQARAVGDAYGSAMFSAVGPPPASPIPKKPGFFKRLLGAKEQIDSEAWEEHKRVARDYVAKLLQYSEDNPIPDDPYDLQVASRIGTPFDKSTNYKLNMNLDYRLPGATGGLDKYVTDEAYSDKPVIRNLSRKDLQKVVREYKSRFEEAKKQWANDSNVLPGGRAFLQKAEYLLKHPKFQFARLEMQ